MRVRLGASEVVDQDELHVVAAAFDGGAQDEAPDAPEPVDRDLHGHGDAPLRQFGRWVTWRGGDANAAPTGISTLTTVLAPPPLPAGSAPAPAAD